MHGRKTLRLQFGSISFPFWIKKKKKLISAHSQNHWNMKPAALKMWSLQFGILFSYPSKGWIWRDGEIEPFLQFLAPTKNM